MLDVKYNWAQICILCPWSLFFILLLNSYFIHLYKKIINLLTAFLNSGIVFVMLSGLLLDYYELLSIHNTVDCSNILLYTNVPFARAVVAKVKIMKMEVIVFLL